MIEYEEILKIQPYSLEKDEKRDLLNQRLRFLAKHHCKNCEEYKRIVEVLGVDLNTSSYEEIPFIPVRLFKDLNLKSVQEGEIFKTMTSSGTTGQSVSKIFLDRKTAMNQQKTLVKIVSSFLGTSRAPMMIIDCPSVMKDRNHFSARGAGILGFSIFASDRIFALTDDMELNLEDIKRFLEKHKKKKIFVFGFTFMIWQFFYKKLLFSIKFILL